MCIKEVLIFLFSSLGKREDKKGEVASWRLNSKSVAKFEEELQTLNHSLNFPQTINSHAKCKGGNKYVILEFQTANSAFVKECRNLN